jgi:hypothetical protein
MQMGNHFHPSRIAEDIHGIIVTMRSRFGQPETRKGSKESNDQPGDRHCGRKGSQPPDIDCIDPGERPISLVTGANANRSSTAGTTLKWQSTAIFAVRISLLFFRSSSTQGLR